ncbi:MAG: hypothetical protein JXA97_14360 [Anaerolineales bacterium]|nr:hypothetical protein [Anaerolineales bacterium]
MIDIHVPASLEYNTAEASLLAAALKKIHSFNEVAEWNKKATAEVEALQSILRALEGKHQTANQVVLRDRQEHAAKPFLHKLFDGRKEQKRWLAEQSRLAREKAQIENLIGQFESAIDFTPHAPEELEKLVEECKKQKEELIAEKKAVNAQMSSIRVDAKQQTANTTYGKYGKEDRRLIRLNKKFALQPQGSHKTAIKRQVIKLDQIITWLERFD